MIDLLPYLKGDGRFYSLRYTWGGGGNQVLQTQVDGQRFFTVKWAQWEEMFADDAFIYRALDTSPGGGQVYALLDAGRAFGSRWVKRHQDIGGVTERNPTVIWYDKATGRELRRGEHRTWLRLERQHETWPTPAGYTARDVIELAWYLDAGMTQKAETYWYARSFGLVGWQGGLGKSYIESVFPSHPPLVRETLPWYRPVLTPVPVEPPPPEPVPVPEPPPPPPPPPEPEPEPEPEPPPTTPPEPGLYVPLTSDELRQLAQLHTQIAAIFYAAWERLYAPAG